MGKVHSDAPHVLVYPLIEMYAAGMATRTAPSGLALVTIMDLDFKTTIGLEFGVLQAIGLFSLVYLTLILKPAVSGWSVEVIMLVLAACLIPLLILLKVLRILGKSNNSFFTDNDVEKTDNSSIVE